MSLRRNPICHSVLIRLSTSFVYIVYGSSHGASIEAIHQALIGGTINRIIPLGGLPLDRLKLFISIILAVPLGSIVSNSQFWKCSAARVIAIFGSHVGSHISNIGHFKVYEGI